MSFFNAKNKEIIGISINPDTITCSWLSKIKNDILYTTQALETLPFDKAEIQNLIIYNPITITALISSFIKKHKLWHSYVVISLNGTGIKEQIISLSADPKSHQIKGLDTLVWDYQTIGYNRQNGKTLYYVCGTNRQTLFQYQLLAIKLGLRCIQIIPHRAALLHACTVIKKSDDFTNALITNHASLQNYLSQTIEHSSLQTMIHGYNKQIEDKASMFEALGLFLLGMQTYEYY